MTLPANLTPATTDEKVVITIEFAIPHPTQAGPTAEQVVAACGPEIIALAGKVKTKTPSPVSLRYDTTPAVYVV